MKEIQLLEEQLLKLDEKDFNFKSWKQYSVILLSRIFGEGDQKVKQLSVIEMDYSSWSLRDTSGKRSQLETNKNLGREILLVAIDELKSFGLPDKNQLPDSNLPLGVIVSALEKELKISQYREIVNLINGEMSWEAKKSSLENKLNEFGSQLTMRVLANILSDDKLKNKL